MGFLNLFRSKSFHPEEFEQQLTALTQAISQNREQIAALAAKQKAWRRSLSLYCAVVYVSYIAFRYTTSVGHEGVVGSSRSRASVFIRAQSRRNLAAMVLMPVVFTLVVYIVNSLFAVLIRSKNKALRTLLKKHKEKLDELKQVTNFSRTNQILEKFDTGEKAGNVRHVTEAKSARTPVKPKGDHQKDAPKAPQKTQSPAPQLPPTVNVPNRASHVTTPQVPKPPAQPESTKLTIQDRLLDFIIGSDHNENVENRYALICANCYTHNGLAPPGCQNPFNVTYICRNCGYINAELSAGHRKTGQTSVVPEKEEIIGSEVSEATVQGSLGTAGGSKSEDRDEEGNRGDEGNDSEEKESEKVADSAVVNSEPGVSS